MPTRRNTRTATNSQLSEDEQKRQRNQRHNSSEINRRQNLQQYRERMAELCPAIKDIPNVGNKPLDVMDAFLEEVSFQQSRRRRLLAELEMLDNGSNPNYMSDVPHLKAPLPPGSVELSMIEQPASVQGPVSQNHIASPNPNSEMNMGNSSTSSTSYAQAFMQQDPIISPYMGPQRLMSNISKPLSSYTPASSQQSELTPQCIDPQIFIGHQSAPSSHLTVESSTSIPSVLDPSLNDASTTDLSNLELSDRDWYEMDRSSSAINLSGTDIFTENSFCTEKFGSDRPLEISYFNDALAASSGC